MLRSGLWILIIALALYVVHESYEDSPVAEFVPLDVLQKGIALGGVLIAAGLVFKLLEKGARVVVRNRCQVCRTAIPEGAIYCRAHLRALLAEEDEKTHMTKVRRTDPDVTRARRKS